ncbi:XdhC family protein [Streptomyces hoynatensis]|uniref:XdhC/CoxI family protein n=1 Tax=Streptomyces hoynatensis TaxID=1141874 RepID=A0A3A9YQJ4_9ACTN|nr:XdhC/CoxI family protein [Streptomyces hoynatensis]RKN38288.1 XdhC/CoxI family protein [Streptomyces hoynatensis]
MLDLAAELDQWCREGRAFAVATVVAVGGSAPRRPGAALAVAADGTALGSVSGGCVEGAVYELCRQALDTGRPLVERFGYADADGLAVGLTCGGSVEVLVTPVPADAPARPALGAALAAAARGEAAALARVVAGPAPLPGGALLVTPGARAAGGLGLGAALDGAAARAAADALGAGRTGTVRVGDRGGLCGRQVTLFVECSLPPPRMLVFGAADFAAALVRAGAFLGYRVTVCDARPVFATAARFPGAAEVVADWPHRYLESERDRLDARTVVCVLTHDAKFDVPLLVRALRLPVAYVGALGSRRTHADRLRRLREAGATEEELARLRAPIGLDLGARTPEETALAIVAEVVALRRGGTGRPLTGTNLPLHRTVTGAF